MQIINPIHANINPMSILTLLLSLCAMSAQNVTSDIMSMMEAMEKRELERLAGVPTVSSTSSNDVMLITGGKDGSSLSSVEIFDPSNPSVTCPLPDMTSTRYDHAGVGMTMCGADIDGGDGFQSCEMFDGQQWTESHSLQSLVRFGHVMWKSPNKGIMIMGGFNRNLISKHEDRRF